MRGKRKNKHDITTNSTTTKFPGDHFMNIERNFEVGSTSTRQRNKRSKLYNGPGSFDPEATVGQLEIDYATNQQPTVTSDDTGNIATFPTIGNSLPEIEYTRTGVSSFYLDLGDCDQVCEYCNALFWYQQRLKAHVKGKIPYNRCCAGGKVVLPMEPDPPEYIKELYKNKHFLENIRAYNQMFSMTSFGAHIDDSINKGKGPYVFKISGQVYHWIGTLCPTEGNPPRFLQLYVYDTQNEVTNRMQHFGGPHSCKLSSEIVEGLIHFLNEHNELVKLFRTARDKCQDNDVPEFKVRLYSVAGVRQYELPTSETLGAIVFESGEKTETDYDVALS